jgi:hypothetical protein
LARSAEANQLYELLENEVTEVYYKRGENEIPIEWVKMMKNSIAEVCNGFNMHRTVRNYLNKFYLPLVDVSKKLTEDDDKLLSELGKYRKKIDAVWSHIYIKDYFTSINGKMPVSGEKIDVDCYVYLGEADEKLIDVEVFYCNDENTSLYKKIELGYVEKYKDNVAKYSGTIMLEGIGLQEISVRLVPSDPYFRTVYPEYIKWKE